MFKKTFLLTSILLISILLTGCAGAAFAQTPGEIAQAVTQTSESETYHSNAFCQRQWASLPDA